MTTSAKRHGTLPVAANDRSDHDASPRIKLYKRGIAIRHADPKPANGCWRRRSAPPIATRCMVSSSNW
jgi:hypothetical protein